MQKLKINKIYKNKDGEYFKTVMRSGDILLDSPSYPFLFLPGVQFPLEEIGSAKEFEHLMENKNYEFHSGETLELMVTKDGKLAKKE